MRRLILACCFVALAAMPVRAQSADYQPRFDGFLFLSPGVRSDTGESTLTMGAGVAGYVYRGFGLSADLGWMKSPHWSERATILSVNALYSVVIPDHPRLLPFGTIGLAFSSFDTPAGYNLGAGVEYWFNKNAGVRIQVHDCVFVGNSSHHYPGARFAIALRGTH